jgi:peptidase E
MTNSSQPPPLILLGPQRLRPTLVNALDSLRIEGTVAAVTAGWQEREEEVDELREHVDRPVVNLLLHARAEQLFEQDPELLAGYRARQEELRELQRLYRARLAHALAASRELFATDAEPELLLPERKSAIGSVRRLDHHHLRRVRQVHQEFEQRYAPWERPSVARVREQLAEQLADASALAIAGGHVAILLNRLRLFGVLELARELPIVAWSAGAMVLGDQLVLFHDSPPQGPGDAEVLETGLGLFDNLLPLPHARRRLRLNDPVRVALFARRFAPARCVALDEGSRIERRFEDGKSRWHAAAGTLRLTPRGKMQEIAA